MELLHMGITLLISTPFSAALTVVESVVVPMVFANASGMFIFAIFVSNLIKERKTREERDKYQKELIEKEIRIRELEIDKLKKYSKELEIKVKTLEIKIDEKRARRQFRRSQTRTTSNGLRRRRRISGSRGNAKQFSLLKYCQMQ
jgi:uncharacterized protein YlxW (UPF0749 family)